MLFRCLCLLLGALLCLSCGAADDLPAQLRLTHTGPDTWRADYALAEAVTRLDFGPAAKVLALRKQAWRVLTPGVVLGERDGHDVATVSGKPITALSIEIGTYQPFAQGNYAPINRFSDGGAAIYLGFLRASVFQREGGPERELAFDLQLTGLGAETVIRPQLQPGSLNGYAYFGPSAARQAGPARLVLDPQAPPWMVQVLSETTAKTATYYAEAFGRAPPQDLPVLVAIAGFTTRGLSLKGGAVGGQVVYRMEGDKLLVDTPAHRALLAMIVAHEMAHVWQANVKAGGIGADEPWVHEGGAESIALAAMRATGIWSAEQADQYSQKLLDECGALKGALDSYRSWYACGYQRFHGYALAPVPLWRRMMIQAEQRSAFYSSKMIDAILASPVH